MMKGKRTILESTDKTGDRKRYTLSSRWNLCALLSRVDWLSTISELFWTRTKARGERRNVVTITDVLNSSDAEIKDGDFTRVVPDAELKEGEFMRVVPSFCFPESRPRTLREGPTSCPLKLTLLTETSITLGGRRLLDDEQEFKT